MSWSTLLIAHGCVVKVGQEVLLTIERISLFLTGDELFSDMNQSAHFMIFQHRHYMYIYICCSAYLNAFFSLLD